MMPIFTTLIERIKPTWLFPHSQTEDASDIFEQLMPEENQTTEDDTSYYLPTLHFNPPSGTPSVVHFSPPSGTPLMVARLSPPSGISIPTKTL